MRQKKFTVHICAVIILIVLNIVQAEERKPAVVFDQGHGQKFVVEKEGDLHLSRLSGLLKEKGFDIRINTGKIDDTVLNTADILLIPGAFQSLSPDEIDGIAGFLERGGKLCIMLHIPQPLKELMNRLGVYASNGVIQEQDNTINSSPKDFYITNMEKHEITRGLAKIGVHGAWALMTDRPAGQVIARTGPKAWIDLNRDGKYNETDARQSFGVVIAGTFGKGKYIVFGDDAIFQNKFLEQENMPLAKNLADWMK